LKADSQAASTRWTGVGGGVDWPGAKATQRKTKATMGVGIGDDMLFL
jgi:hypothetical protein